MHAGAFLTLMLTTALVVSPVHAMGPDPGGHTGDKVTPETTKTDRPEIDAKRKEASGERVETNAPAGGGQPRKESDK